MFLGYVTGGEDGRDQAVGSVPAAQPEDVVLAEVEEGVEEYVGRVTGPSLS